MQRAHHRGVTDRWRPRPRGEFETNLRRQYGLNVRGLSDGPIPVRHTADRTGRIDPNDGRFAQLPDSQRPDWIVTTR